MLYRKIEDMPHLSPEEFCADMDGIFEKVTLEREAYILDTEKGQYVLCPADWLVRPYRRLSSLMANYAAKYAFSQNIETSALIRADIRKRMHELSYGTIEKMIVDISTHLQSHSNDPAHADWSNLCEELCIELTQTDTEEVTLELDINLLRQMDEYARKRDITLQQLTEMQFERIVEEGFPDRVVDIGTGSSDASESVNKERKQ